MSAQPLKIGLIGLDTSHVIAFTKIFNLPTEPYHIPGAKVVAGFPGGSPDFELSRSRVDNFAKQLREEFGVQILSSPAAVAEQVDLVFIESVDGRVHLRQFEETIKYRRPTFIDKPLAVRGAEAETILRLAREQGVPVMCSSALRYADNFHKALEPSTELGRVLGIDAFGPMSLEPTQPGMFWYGVHSAEMIVAALGAGFQRVQALVTDGYDLITAAWSDGRSATYRGMRVGCGQFGATLHYEKGVRFIDIQANARPFYAGLLEAVMRSLPAGRSDVPPEQMLEVVHFIEAANASRNTGEAVDRDAGMGKQ